MFGNIVYIYKNCIKYAVALFFHIFFYSAAKARSTLSSGCARDGVKIQTAYLKLICLSVFLQLIWEVYVNLKAFVHSSITLKTCDENSDDDHHPS